MILRLITIFFLALTNSEGQRLRMFYAFQLHNVSQIFGGDSLHRIYVNTKVFDFAFKFAVVFARAAICALKLSIAANFGKCHRFSYLPSELLSPAPSAIGFLFYFYTQSLKVFSKRIVTLYNRKVKPIEQGVVKWKALITLSGWDM